MFERDRVYQVDLRRIAMRLKGLRLKGEMQPNPDGVYLQVLSRHI